LVASANLYLKVEPVVWFADPALGFHPERDADGIYRTPKFENGNLQGASIFENAMLQHLGLLQLCIRLARILFFCMWPCMTHVRGRF
jgi:hypothetical protein